MHNLCLEGHVYAFTHVNLIQYSRPPSEMKTETLLVCHCTRSLANDPANTCTIVWVDQNAGGVNIECIILRIWPPILRLVANYMMGKGDLPILRLVGFHIWLLQ